MSVVPKIFLQRCAVTVLAAVLCWAVAATSSAWAATSEWTWHRTADGKHPNGREQQRVWLMNRARQNPSLEGEWLASASSGQIKEPRDYFDVDTAKLRQEFSRIAPAAPAAFDVRLYKAAREHAVQLIRRDAQDHNGQAALVRAHDFLYVNLRGNVFSYASSSLNAHAGFNIDWGPGTSDGMQQPRNHRKAIMATKVPLPHVGIAVVREANTATTVGPEVYVDNMARSIVDNQTYFNAFITGTVWQDANGNDMYDPGEGIDNVLVNPDQGVYYALTSAGGGYAIPITNPGRTNVSFSGSGIGSYTVNVSAGTSSVLVDYKLPAPVIIQAPDSAEQTSTSDVWLDRGVKNGDVFGHRLNIEDDVVNARDSVRAQFWGTGDDVRLSLKGYDIDRRGEVTVSLNGTALTSLRTGPDNGYNVGDVILLPKELQRTDDVNEVLIEQGTSGFRWGIKSLMLTSLEAGEELNMKVGELVTARRGWKYGPRLHKGGIVINFDGAAKDLAFSVQGYDIDSKPEATVFLNGKRIGVLRLSANKQLNSGNVFKIKAAKQQSGNNRLIIVQRRPGNMWGVRNMHLYDPAENNS